MYGDEVAGKRFSSCFFAILTENKSSYCSMLYCFLPILCCKTYLMVVQNISRSFNFTLDLLKTKYAWKTK